MNSCHLPQFKKMLLNLDACLEKASAFADAKKFDANVLAGYRLAPDMFPLTKQVQSACDAAKFAAAYLSEQTAPSHEDNEKTLPELRARIQKVVKFIETIKTSATIDQIKVKPKWAQGQWVAGNEYLEAIAIPNFYFHLMASYAILRHAGVSIGKMDYLGSVNLKGERTPQ